MKMKTPQHWATRLGVGIFLVFFIAYDTLAGIGIGLAMRSVRDLSATQQEGVFEVVKDWPGLGPAFALSIIGTLGWVIAVGGIALAARRQGAPDTNTQSRVRHVTRTSVSAEDEDEVGWVGGLAGVEVETVGAGGVDPQ